MSRCNGHRDQKGQTDLRANKPPSISLEFPQRAKLTMNTYSCSNTLRKNRPDASYIVTEAYTLYSSFKQWTTLCPHWCAPPNIARIRPPWETCETHYPIIVQQESGPSIWSLNSFCIFSLVPVTVFNQMNQNSDFHLIYHTCSSKN